MTDRISDERLAFAIEQLRCVPNSSSAIWLAELEELQQSRALVTELQFKLEGATDLHRALVLQLGAMADGLRKDIPEPSPDHSPLQSQKSIFARKFLFEIDSLLAAHDTQQAEGKAE